MRSIFPRSNSRLDRGFTLVEMLVIAPIAILIISGFVTLMISMISDVLVTRDQGNMAYEAQDALNHIEQDTRLTTQFLVTTGTLPSPQGSDSNFTGTAAFNGSSSTLIMGGLTTDKNPADTSRQLIYYANQPNDCGTLQSYNRVFQSKVMYFINNGSLWRRAVLPDYNTITPVNDSTVCNTPWQRDTCSPGYTGIRCKTNDAEMMKNVNTFSVKYLSDPASNVDLGSANALAAKAIDVTLTGTKKTAGRNITTSANMRATKLNAIDVDLPLPNTPVVTASPSGASVVFSWQLIPNATSYLISYNINGGSWINATVDNRTSSYTVNANRNDTVTIQVTSKNSTGPSATYGTAAATVPSWYNCSPLQNGWSDFGSPYAGNEYTKTSNDLVMLHGLIKGGTATAGTVICILPAAYRPSARLLFHTISNGVASRIDVYPTGEVVSVVAGSPWLVLDGIQFIASTSSMPWTNLSLVNSWSAFGSGFATPQYGLDGAGRVQIQGLANRTTSITNSTIAQVPAAYKPLNNLFAMSSSNSNSYELMTIDAAGNLANAFTNANYFATQAMYYPSTYASSNWTGFTLQNGWTNLGGGWDTAQYTKSADGVVTMKGTIKGGSAFAGILIATLPPGYRPLATTIMTITGANAYARIDLQPDGKLLIDTANSTYINLNFSFVAEQ